MPRFRYNDSVNWFMNEFTSRLVAKTGIVSDRYHLGKLVLQGLKDDPEFISQIDAATNQKETNGSVLKRSVQCAIALRDTVKIGDVIMLMGPNILDVVIPLYAGLYIGAIIAPVDHNSSIEELRSTCKLYNPKVIFCETKRISNINVVLKQLNSTAQVITFGEDHLDGSFSKILNKYCDNNLIDDFSPADINGEETIGFLFPTSGTTAPSKGVALTHKNFIISIPYIWSRHDKFPTPTSMALATSPLHGVAAMCSFLFPPIFKFTRLQTSRPRTTDHLCDVINNYKPTFWITFPYTMRSLLASSKHCDISCFEMIQLVGSAASQDLIDKIKTVAPKTTIIVRYGLTETAGIVFYGDGKIPGSVGKQSSIVDCRLINIETQEDIYEPNIPGELWLKGPIVFKEYYNNPEETMSSFSNGWFKTGDLFYIDENGEYFFVERQKMMFKYQGFKISPLQIELYINQHPDVVAAAVTGKPDPYCGELPMAFVVRRHGSNVSSEDIKNLVKETLSGHKQLRGGVIFVDKLPMTPSMKIDRKKLKNMISLTL